jgi:hypothetical protein
VVRGVEQGRSGGGYGRSGFGQGREKWRWAGGRLDGQGEMEVDRQEVEVYGHKVTVDRENGGGQGECAGWQERSGGK